ncbi:uncharacterized protein LOC129905223 [Episyrphus balteatus]|uniref:uncharacterized protein LOC129905223 n=1 Tax=Episyrphus balteatus TaxID=286459 RepID=UPI002484F446|nr:uncharacterized protein LOC129905223 [Episyrphus balteatus]
MNTEHIQKVNTGEPNIQPPVMTVKDRFKLLINILDKSLEKVSAELSQGRNDIFCKIKIKSIEQNWTEIMDIFKTIGEYASVEDIQIYFDMQDRVELALMELCEQMEHPKAMNRSIEMPIAATMKLPKIELPKFDGNYLNWRQFYDLFKQLIHDQPIPPAQKLYFLRANVTGDAHSLIQHFQPTDKNYDVAWKTLVDRFDNRRLLLTAQLTKMLSQSPAIGTASSINRMHDTTKEGMQAISNLGFDTSSWDPIIVHLILQKLDKESRTLFEQSLDDPRSSPTLDELLKFAESRFQTLEAISSRDDRKKTSALVAANSDNSINCAMCNSGNHTIYNCSQFLLLSDLDKDKAVRRLQLCRNCLKVGHHAQSCQSRRCQRCDGRHNTLLHHFQSTKQFDTTKSHFNKEQNYKGEDSSSQPQQLMNKAENSIKLSTNINNQQNHKDSTSQHDQPQQQIIKPTEIPTKVCFGTYAKILEALAPRILDVTSNSTKMAKSATKSPNR